MSTPGSLLIDGEWLSPADQFEVTNPADGSLVGYIGWGTAKDAVRAADAAADAFTDWAAMPPRQRSDMLLRAAELITDRASDIGSLLAREAGKRLPEAIGEVTFSAEYFRWFAEEVRRPSGHVVPHELADRRHLTIRAVRAHPPSLRRSGGRTWPA